MASVGSPLGERDSVFTGSDRKEQFKMFTSIEGQERRIERLKGKTQRGRGKKRAEERGGKKEQETKTEIHKWLSWR